MYYTCLGLFNEHNSYQLTWVSCADLDEGNKQSETKALSFYTVNLNRGHLCQYVFRSFRLMSIDVYKFRVDISWTKWIVIRLRLPCLLIIECWFFLLTIIAKSFTKSVTLRVEISLWDFPDNRQGTPTTAYVTFKNHRWTFSIRMSIVMQIRPFISIKKCVHVYLGQTILFL